jgi:addiction module RelE/StbE family toxin
MQIIYTKRFERAYKKLSHVQRTWTDETIRLFAENPMAPALRNHELKGKLKGIRSLKAGYDLRILYTEQDGHAVVFFIEVGTHERVY